MRILVAIPHAFLDKAGLDKPGPDKPGLDKPGLDKLGGAGHGSEAGDAAKRSAVLLRCVSALHHTFRPGQRLIGHDDPVANTGWTALSVVVCTAGEQHLIDTLPPGLVHHHRTDLHPRMLGFECQAVLRANLDRFDWFCYLEDDLELLDALLFDKLAWFNQQFGRGVLLQPNRFEVSAGPVSKLFIDGLMTDEAATRAYQDITVRPRLVAPLFGRSVEFRRVANPHSGCFFVNAAQMAAMAAHPAFDRYDTSFYGPLESAATLMLMRCFDVYKPARTNASFLEVRHLDQRLLDRKVSYSQDGDRLVKTVQTDG